MFDVTQIIPPKLKLGVLDHYTIIAVNAEKSCEFHVNFLGFKFKSIKLINTGSANENEYDMINYILTLPDNPDIFCVITEGLNEETVFRKYLKKYGEGIHHVAYCVDDITHEWAVCNEQKIITTSDEVIIDPVSGLKQFFISREMSGYFIELIERIPEHELQNTEDFTEENMKRLSDSIRKFVQE